VEKESAMSDTKTRPKTGRPLSPGPKTVVLIRTKEERIGVLEHFKKRLGESMAEKGVTLADIGEALGGVSSMAASRRISSGKLTVADLRAIAPLVGWDADEYIEEAEGSN